MTLYLHTDTSDAFWAAIVTQCPKEDLDHGIVSQAHKPLELISGAFTDLKDHWNTSEK